MDSSGGRRRSGVVILVVFLLLLLPVLYVLSMGPVVMMVEKTGVGREQVELVYMPVIWLHDNTPLEKPLEMYGELWGWR